MTGAISLVDRTNGHPRGEINFQRANPILKISPRKIGIITVTDELTRIKSGNRNSANNNSTLHRRLQV